MNKWASIILISIGVLFLVYAIFGRYLVLPGYLEGLEQGNTTLATASQDVSAWKVIRYLLRAYSFKLGLLFIVFGAAFLTNMSSKGKIAIAVGGLIYVSFAYIPLPSPASIVFGIAGGIMTLFVIFISYRWAAERDQLEDYQREASDYRMAGYFFFAMATYTICPLLGVKTFALSPEKMIEYGLELEAASFAFHLLIELVLGWSFIALSTRKEKKAAVARQAPVYP